LLRRAIREQDVIYVPTGLKSFLYAFMMKGRRKLVAGPNVSPLPVPGRHDSPGRIELGLMADYWFEASIYRQLHVITESGINSIGVVHHAIDSSKFSPIREDPEIWKGFGIDPSSLKVKVLYVGHDETSRKGVEILLTAIATMNEMVSQPDQLEFFFAGTLSETNLDRIAALSNAHYIGFQSPDRLPAVIASADIVVVPSSWENFPFSVLEAMASGRAIVASRAGGIPEQLVDGESGVLIDITENGQFKADARAILAHALTELASDSNKRNNLGASARMRALSQFSEERLGEDLYRIFKSLLNR
jgi:starch synthase